MGQRLLNRLRRANHPEERGDEESASSLFLSKSEIPRFARFAARSVFQPAPKKQGDSTPTPLSPSFFSPAFLGSRIVSDLA